MPYDTPANLTQREAADITLLNSPERVRRVERFHVRIKLVHKDSELTPCLEFSDPVCASKERWTKLERYLEREFLTMKPSNFNCSKLEAGLMLMMQRLLMMCVFKFADEIEDGPEVFQYWSQDESADDELWMID